MLDTQHRLLSEKLWSVLDELKGVMDEYRFRDLMFAFLFFHYLSFRYERVVSEHLGRDGLGLCEYNSNGVPDLSLWYEKNPDDLSSFEQEMRTKIHYVIRPEYLWRNIVHMASTQNGNLLSTLQSGLNYIENQAFDSNLSGLFSTIDLDSYQIGRTHGDRNRNLCIIVTQINEIISEFFVNKDRFNDVFECLIGIFNAVTFREYKEFYTPRTISDILSSIATLDSYDPQNGRRTFLPRVMDFTCGSASLLLNVCNRMGSDGVGKIYGQEKDIKTYNLARMNMIIHGMKDSDFELHHGDTLHNDWPVLCEMDPEKKNHFDAIVFHPPRNRRWYPNDTMDQDIRFKDYALAERSLADFPFLLHGLYYLKKDGVMAIIFSCSVLSRDGSDAEVRRKLVEDGHIDAVIGLPGNLLYSTGSPVCILVLKKCRKARDVLFINAHQYFEKGNRQDYLLEKHVSKIVETYQKRPQHVPRYARRVKVSEIRDRDYNLNCYRYVSMAESEIPVDLPSKHNELMKIERQIQQTTEKNNVLLRELGLSPFRMQD